MNVVAVLEILRYLSDHQADGDIRIPELLDMLRDAGYPMSRATITRLLADAEAHLDVRIVYDGVGSIGGYRIDSWGLLDRGAVLESGEPATP